MSQLFLSQLLSNIKEKKEQSKSLQFVGFSLALKQLLVSNLLKMFISSSEQRQLVFICPTLKEQVQWKSFIESLLYQSSENLPLFELFAVPYWDLIKLKEHEKLRFQSLSAAHSLLDNTKKSIIFSTPSGFQQKLFEFESFKENSFSLKVKQEIEMEELEEKLFHLGYREANFVSEKGFFARRGGVLDFFSIASDKPTRCEFFANKIASLRSFDATCQKTLSDIEELVLTPCWSFSFSEPRKKELSQDFFSFLSSKSLDEKHKLSLLKSFGEKSYLFEFERILPGFESSYTHSLTLVDKKTDIVLLGSLADMNEELGRTKEELALVYDALGEYPEALGDPKDHFFPRMSFSSQLKKWPLISFSNHEMEEGFLKLSAASSAFSQPFLVKKDLEREGLFNKLFEFYENSHRVVLFFEGKKELEKAENFLLNKSLSYSIKHSLLLEIESFLNKPSGASFTLSLGSFKGSLVDQVSQTLFCDGHMLFPKKKKFKKKSNKSLFLQQDIIPGDYVVHETHGVARFSGLKEVDVGGGFFDFLKLLYKNDDVLYVPVDKMDVLSKYQKSGQEHAKVSLDKLGGKSWVIKKKKVEENIRELAKAILDSEAARKLVQTTGFAEGGELYYDFCSDFPFKETEDQAKAISEVEGDLQAVFYMDRLLVGDVGFGKTEVAMRAAMHTVLDGQQVLFFVPTTILCEQHYLRFLQRFTKYGVKIGVLSRFQKKDSKKTLEKFEKGQIDILIGTHALLSLKLQNHRVALIILDEEHKLGVKHKKHFRELAGHTNILTMTATPLPRTLNMALSGLRDISLIQEPPTGRLSVKTFFSEMSILVLKNALNFELKRNGQMIYLHNTIENFPKLERDLKDLAPELRVTKVHGRLKPADLSLAMTEFSEGRTDLLLATTIVESGVDIPNVNTLVVSDSERYGLSQLHQIRGRVGRSSVQSYAYFFYQRKEALTEAAKGRMEAMLSHESLGAGFHLASADMTLRGVGNLLGSEQSGDVLSVGVDLYLNMLEETVTRLKSGKPSSQRVQPEIKVKQKVGIPHTYVSSEKERLSLYSEVLKIESVEELDELLLIWQDLYGPAPIEVKNLCFLAKVKIFMIELGAKKISELKKGKTFELIMLEPEIAHDLLESFLGENSAKSFFLDQYFIKVRLEKNFEAEGVFLDLCAFLKDLISFLGKKNSEI